MALVERMLSAESQGAGQATADRPAQYDGLGQLTRAASGSAALRQAGLAQARITLSDDSPKLAQLCTRWPGAGTCRRCPAGGLGLIVVDYPQLFAD